MNNTCLKEEEKSQPKYDEMELLQKIGVLSKKLNEADSNYFKLKLENEQLESEKDYWKDSYTELHNKIVNEECIRVEIKEDHNEGGWTAKEFEAVSKAYADFGY